MLCLGYTMPQALRMTPHCKSNILVFPTCPHISPRKQQPQAANLPALRMKSLKNCWHPGNEGGGQGPLMLWGTTNLSCSLFRRLRLSEPSILRTSWSGVSPQLAPPPIGPLHIFRRQKDRWKICNKASFHFISHPTYSPFLTRLCSRSNPSMAFSGGPCTEDLFSSWQNMLPTLAVNSLEILRDGILILYI